MVETAVAIGKEALKGPGGRIRDAHQQVKITMFCAFIMAILAVLATLIHSDVGRWLPLHLFFTGTLLLAISGATQLFSVAWSAAQPLKQNLVNAQRATIIIGSLGLAASRSLGWPHFLTAIFGTILTSGIIFLMYLLHKIHKGAIQRRFRGVYFAYLVALSCGILGTIFGSVLVEGHVTGRSYIDLRDAHLIINLWGLVGLTIGATLPSFMATQVRQKMSPRATPNMHLIMTSWMLFGVLLAVAGKSFSVNYLAILGIVIYIVGIVIYVAMLPSVGMKQIKWAGPRLFMLYSGIAWWIASCVVLIIKFANHDMIAGSQVIPMLVIGGYAQILFGSLSYFGPIVTARTPEMRTDNLRHTRAWPSYFVWNVIALTVTLSWPLPILWVASAVVGVDVAIRFTLLLKATKLPVSFE